MPSLEFLGPYKIGDLLGRGGMGNVYAGEHVKSGQLVAVKLIADHVANEPRFRRRFDKEIRAMKMLRHPGIVQLIGYGEEDGQLFYSMELVEGETLQDRIRSLKKLDWKVVMDYSIQICAALKHAHDIGVTHRDLKPANLIITPEEQLKLVDFGIPKLFGDGEQTMPGSVLGTPDYMAPEQATGGGVTPRTDLYALGSVMYAMLSGRAPFKGRNATEVIESLKRDRPVPLDFLEIEMPNELMELVHQLLEKSPEDRPPTALSVMNRLKAMKAGLQQQQTVLKHDPGTEVGFESAEMFDTSDGGDTGVKTNVSSQKTGEGNRSVVSRGGGAANKSRKTAPSEMTVDSAVDHTLKPGSMVDEDDDDGVEVKSHFQTVDLSRPTTGIFGEESSETDHAGPTWPLFAGIIGILLLAGMLIFYATRKPSANELYDRAASGDIDAIRAFLSIYSNDDRHDEVFNMDMEYEKRSLLKRLKAQRKFDMTPLEPIEDGFVSAMEGRERKPAQAAEKLEQWLNAFDSPDSKPDPKFSDMVLLARHEQKQLVNRAPEIPIDPRAQAMIEDIRETMEKSDPETARKQLLGIISTFENKKWAAPAVDEARRQLDTLDEFSP